MENYLSNAIRLKEAIRSTFIRKLLQFYMPSKRQYILIEWKPTNFHYTKIGYTLLKILSHSKQQGINILSQPSDFNFFNVKDSFMSELANFLTEETKKMDNPASLFSPYNFSVKMVREYVQWIGLMSSSKDGLKLLC